MPSVVLAPFAGAYDLLSVGYYSGPVQALSECVPNQGSRRGVVTVDPTMDIAQQKLPLFDGDAELLDPGVASFVEFAFYKNEGFGVMCEPPSLHLICWQCVTEEVVEVGHSLVDQRVGFCRWIFFELLDFRAECSRCLFSPRAGIGRTITALS